MDKYFDVGQYLKDLETENKQKWEKTSVTDIYRINLGGIYTQTPHWVKITGGIVAVYADMINSSAVNVNRYRQNKVRGRIFDIFTGGLARIFHDFEVVHLDIEGDGVLGIWNGGDDRFKAFCAAVTFRSYMEEWLTRFVKNEVKDLDEIGVRIGIDEEEAIVKYVGVRDDKNLVWAGGPVTSASKLCKIHTFKDQYGNELTPSSHIAVSDRFFDKVCEIEEIRMSCGCRESGETIGQKTDLWKSYPVPENMKDVLAFEKYYVLTSKWCPKCGTDYCQKILSNVKIKE